jgi:hypothetical protein
MTGQWNRFWTLAIRDTLLVALAFVLWHYTLQAGPARGIGGIALHIVTGLMTVLCGFVLPATPFESPFLFRYNRIRNDRQQFFVMSMGGFMASIIFVAWLPFGLPWGMLATYIADGITALGVLATLGTEVPRLVVVMRGAPIQDNAAFVSDPVTMAERAQASRQGAP